MNDELVFSVETDDHKVLTKRWNVLIVDDDKDVHQITKLSLRNFVLDGGIINFTSVFSGIEAMKYLEETEDQNIAIILLDVVMETNIAGLTVAEFVRKKLNNHFTRIILRTGEPGNIPTEDVVLKYDINDYKAKAELTYSQLFVTMVTSLRAYDHLIERKHRVIELEKSKKQVEIANHAKTTFIARMSHELLTPLNAIIGFSQILKLNMKSTETQKDMLLHDDILKASYHLKMLIDDMLDLVNSTKSTTNLPLMTCELNDVINESFALVQLSAEKKNISIIKNSTNLSIMANHNRLKQCLVNLLNNAVKFNKEGGKITIKISEVESHYIEISITDTGVGIPTIDQERIFESFGRLDYAEKNEISGMGVGLTLIKQLVQQMNGEIGLKSVLNRGSVFWLRFSKA